MKALLLVVIAVIMAGVGWLYYFTPDKSDMQTIKLYYYNPEKDKDSEGNIMCSRGGLESVERKIKKYGETEKEQMISDIVWLLIGGGLTDEEKARGITTEYPLAGLQLKDIDFNDGAVTLSFDDPQNKTGGGSCRVGVLWFQIQETVQQIPGVMQVSFMPEELFQP